jgi:hypothetical protein
MKHSSPKDSSECPMDRGRSLVLEVRGLGHVPSLKNSMFAIVKKENREWKRRCVHAFALQLSSSFRINGAATPITPSPRSLIAWLPRDDTWKDIPEYSVKSILVPPGEEGAEIKIELLEESVVS